MWNCPKCGRAFANTSQSHFCGKAPETVEEYILAQDESIREQLQSIRTVLKKELPDATEKISWSMPTYWKGQNLIHFAAARRHIGLYPGGEATTVFAAELAPLDVSKGTIRLPYDRDLPEDLITRIARWCFEEYAK